MSAVLLVQFLPVDLLKIVQSFLIPYDPIKHSWGYCAERGLLDGIKWLLKNKVPFPENAWYSAARHGHLAIIQFLHEHRVRGDACHMLYIACREGHFEIVKYVLMTMGADKCTRKAIEAAVFSRRLPILRLMHGLGVLTHDPEYVHLASLNGDIETVQFLHQAAGRLICTSNALDAAAWNGDLDLVRYLHAHGAPCSMLALEGAVRGGHFDVMVFLMTQRTVSASQPLIDKAVAKGGLRMVQYLHTHPLPGVVMCTRKAMDDAAQLNSMDVVRFLQENRTEGCSERAIALSAQHGHFRMVKYLYAHGAPCTPAAVDMAATNGHLDIVRYLINRNVGPTAEALTGAATFGHIKVVRFLITGAFSAETIQTAAEWAMERRRVEVVYLLLQNGASCSEALMVAAARLGYLGFMEFLALHGVPYTSYALCEAAACGKLGTVKFLMDKGVEGVPSAISQSASHGHLDVVRFLCERGVRATVTPICLAAAYDHLDVVKYLHEIGAPYSTVALENAIEQEHFDIAWFLSTHRDEPCSNYAICHAIELNQLALALHLIKRYRYHRLRWALDVARDHHEYELVDEVLKLACRRKVRVRHPAHVFRRVRQAV